MNHKKNSRILIYVTGVALFTLGAGSTEAADLLHFNFSAGVRESYINSRDYGFGGDGMARVKRHLNDLGFRSFTIALRLGMRSPQDSYVFTPVMRTHVNDLEVFINRTAHSESELVLKPVIGQNPELGVLTRLTQIDPKNPSLWFASYRQSINPYLASAGRKKVAEFVLAVGMHKLWTADFADSWVSLAKEAKRRIGSQTRLSVELASLEDMEAFEKWRLQSPQSFDAFISQLDRIRVSAEVGRLSATLYRAKTLFQSKPLVLAHVVIPACNAEVRNENEIQCALGAPHADAYTRQKQLLNQILDELENLPSEVLSVLKQVEIFYATTDSEPAPERMDPRFPMFNPHLKKWLHDWKSRHSFVKAMLRMPSRLACLYYDEVDSKESIGAIQSRLLENLLGAFPNWKIRRENMNVYQRGDMKSCDAIFYLATHFSAVPPEGFYSDVSEAAQSKTVVWMNYRFEDFQKEYKKGVELKGFPSLAFSIPKIDQPLAPPSPSLQDPGFYRLFQYKGETFEKLAYWDPISGNFASSPELNLISISDASKVKVLASVRHSKLDSEVPYVVRQAIQDRGELWYFADSPFSFVHYEDRYLILCDLLWDILRETAPSSPPIALVRIEDVNPSLDLKRTQWAVDYLSQNKVPHALAVIPYYSNLFMDTDGNPQPTFKPSTDYPDFLGFMRYAKARGSEFVFHGMAHQAGDLISGYDGSSADDYEFWLYPEDAPHPQDSSDFVLDRLEMGEEVFRKAGIRPVAWEVPHYAASALDFILFGKLFNWNYHRALYFKGTWDKDSVQLTDRHPIFECLTPECRKERRELARDLKVDVNYKQFSGQIFPYPIYNDSYGQAVIPETLGMIEWAFYPDDTRRLVTKPEDLLRRARKLKVVRGAFASFFWHSELLNPDLIYYKQHPKSYDTVGGKHTLTRIVKGLKEMGYQFRSVGDCKIFPQNGCKNF